MKRELLAAAVMKHGEEWWVEADVTHIVSDLIEAPNLDRDAIAHEMWTMGAWLEHPKCPNNPKRGNDADYSNGCKPCQRHLLVVADLILSEVAVAETAATIERLQQYGKKMLEANGMSWCSMHGRSVLNLIQWTEEEVPDAH